MVRVDVHMHDIHLRRHMRVMRNGGVRGELRVRMFKIYSLHCAHDTLYLNVHVRIHNNCIELFKFKLINIYLLI